MKFETVSRKSFSIYIIISDQLELYLTSSFSLFASLTKEVTAAKRYHHTCKSLALSHFFFDLPVAPWCSLLLSLGCQDAVVQSPI